MKLFELRVDQQEQQIKEMAALFEAVALHQVMLTEGQLDEASAWEKVKSLVGKGVAGVKTANDAVNKLGVLAQNTAPVQDFDSKIATVLKKIGDANPKVAELAAKYGDWAKKNPVKQGLIIGMLTAVASVATGPAGGAAAGAVLRAGNELLKGEKASTAIGKGLKTAAVGAGLGWLAGTSIDALQAGLTVDIPKAPGFPNVADLSMPKITWDYNGRILFDLKNVVMPADTYKQVSDWVNAASRIISSDSEKALAFLEKARQLVADPNLGNRVDAIAKSNAASEAAYKAAKTAWLDSVVNIKTFNDQVSSLSSMLKTVAGGAIQGAAAAAQTTTAANAAQPKAAKAQTTTAANAAPSNDKRAELKARQLAWQAQQRRMGKIS